MSLTYTKKSGEVVVYDYNKWHTAYRKQLKLTVLKHYCGGEPKCQCPGCNVTEILFLTLDHKDGGGRKHREQIGSGWHFYLWIIKNKFPEGFQVLCFNCNSGRQINKGICPHLSYSPVV